MNFINKPVRNTERQSFPQSASPAAHEILIADANVKDLGILLAELNPGVAKWLVKRGDDAIGLIHQALSIPGLKTLHLLAHGSPGKICLGGRAITAADFRSRFDGAAVRDLDIAFWSCRTGAHQAGREFVQAVAEATGARVATAQGLVGSADKGGSWHLSAAVGAPFSDQA